MANGTIQLLRTVQVNCGRTLNTIYQDEETAIIFCPHLDDEAVTSLLALAVDRIILYSDRPNTAADLLSPYKNIQSESALEAVLQQQGANHAA